MRDTLLGLPVRERDWVVVGATPEKMESLKYRQVGKQFPVYLHPETNEEHALARTEKKNGKGHTGFICNFSESITLEEDLTRRDFTINSIAFDAETKKHIDPAGGLKDIEDKIIRHTSPAFSEDPLRLIRLARFYAKLKPLGFTVAPETIAVVQDIVAGGELDLVSVERLWTEFEKAFSYPDPDAFLEILIESGYAKSIALNSLCQEPCRNALKKASELHQSPIIRFAAWCTFAEEEDFTHFHSRVPIPNRYLELSTKTRKNFDDYYHCPKLTIENVLKLIVAINGFKQGDVFHQFLQTAEAVSTSRPTHASIPHPQSRFLITMLSVAKTISAKSIMRRNLEGEEFAKEIDKQRCAAMCKVRRPYRWAHF